MSEPIRILVVDDEPNITELLGMALRYESFEVAVAHSGNDALAAAESFRPHLIVLDIMLPDKDGFAVARELTTRGSRVPIVFLTARDAVEDKVRGLTGGGDDYVTKPFSLEELIARIRAILRRSRQGEQADERLVFSDLELSEDSHEVRRGNVPLELTPTEFRLLHYFMLNPRRVLSKTQILDRIWNYDFGGDANVVETYVSYLRKKLDTAGPQLIHTVRGVGYCLRLPPE